MIRLDGGWTVAGRWLDGGWTDWGKNANRFPQKPSFFGFGGVSFLPILARALASHESISVGVHAGRAIGTPQAPL